MMAQLPVAHVARPDRVFEGAQDEFGVAAIGGLPAHDAVGERVADRGQPEHPLAARDAGGVGDPEPVRCGRGEVPVDQVRGRCRAWVLPRRSGPPSLAQVGALQTGVAPEPFDALARDVVTATAQRGVHARSPVGLFRAVVDLADLGE